MGVKLNLTSFVQSEIVASVPQVEVKAETEVEIKAAVEVCLNIYISCSFFFSFHSRKDLSMAIHKSFNGEYVIHLFKNLTFSEQEGREKRREGSQTEQKVN